MSIIASCGHEVYSGNDLVPVEYDDEESDQDGFHPVTVMCVVCSKCAAEGVKAGEMRLASS